jgi:hypothetical protein
MNKRLPLPPGTKVVAVRNFGPIKEGAPGIITGIMDTPFFFWKRAMYLCTFADNVKIAARPNEIDDFDHQYSLEELEQPRLVLKSPYERSSTTPTTPPRSDYDSDSRKQFSGMDAAIEELRKKNS